jgi:replicative DNA helicase
MKLKHNIGLVTLDYVQLVEASELGRMSGDDRVRTGLVSRRLKKLALELRIPVVMLSQLSRSGDQREGRPRLTDLRDSGCLEQDASKVMMLYKDEEKAEAMDGENPEATKHKRPIWVDLQKHKNGECGRMEFWMFPPYFRMERAAPGFGDDRLPDEAMELARKQGAAGARAAAADGFDGMTDVEEMVAQMELMK